MTSVPDSGDSATEISSPSAEIKTEILEDSTKSVIDAQSDIVNEHNPKNIHYEGDIAVYTDTSTGHQYEWNGDDRKWEYREKTYGYEDGKHTFTDKDGVVFIWDTEKSAWFPRIDDDFMAKYQMSYGFTTTNDTESKPEPTTATASESKEAELPDKDLSVKGEKRKPSTPSWFEPNQQQNNKVYVSNLPLDLTEDEFVELMQKCGIIMRDNATNKLRIKLYQEKDPDGNAFLKGDGLCTYIRVESVDLALKLLDGSNFKGKTIKVERAKFQMKGNYDPNLKPKTKKRKEKEKMKKLQEKLFDWRPEKPVGERSKSERVVIVTNVFESKMFDDDVGLILELQQDLREECSKCGTVRKVIIYDRHPDGIAQINMAEPEEADAAIQLLNGRWFGQRKLSAETWDGHTKYKIAETDSEIQQRLTGWDKFLESPDVATGSKSVEGEKSGSDSRHKK